MITKSKKQKKSKEGRKEEIISQILFFIFTLFLIGFLIFSNIKINQKRGELSGKIESLQKEIQSLEEKKQKLEAGISQTQKESYWEEKIREQGYIKEGENPVVVLPPQKAENEGVEIQEESLSNTFFEKIKDLFAGLVERLIPANTRQ